MAEVRRTKAKTVPKSLNKENEELEIRIYEDERLEISIDCGVVERKCLPRGV